MRQTIRCIIADEASSGESLERMLCENLPCMEIAGKCDTVKEAVKLVVTTNPDLVFLGMEMSDGNGFDFLKMFTEAPFRFILLSVVSDHAVEAFRHSAVDYLLKPVRIEELVRAVNKVKQENSFSKDIKEVLGHHSSGVLSSATAGNVVIPHAKGFTVVKYDDIILCEAEGYCTSFFLKGNTKINSSRNLKHYEMQLPAGRFMRVHNSFIINLEHVKGYTHNGEITLSENLTCTVSAGHRKEFMGAFGKIK